MDERCKALWEKLSAALKPQVSTDTFKRWFSAVELDKATEDSLTFRVPNNIYQFWIESNHMAALQSAIISAVGAPRTVRFLSSTESDNENNFGTPEVQKSDHSSSKTTGLWGGKGSAVQARIASIAKAQLAFMSNTPGPYAQPLSTRQGRFCSEP